MKGEKGKGQKRIAEDKRGNDERAKRDDGGFAT
jgi:hypothetical protein